MKYNGYNIQVPEMIRPIYFSETEPNYYLTLYLNQINFTYSYKLINLGRFEIIETPVLSVIFLWLNIKFKGLY